MIDLFEKKRKYVNYFFDHLDTNKAKEILDILYNCENQIIFTGVGKSASIANKVSLTMLSTGTKALYLPAAEALHGDIAITNANDVLVVFSKSGETQELLNLVFYVKKRKTTTIAIVCNENTTLSKICDKFIVLPLQRELCPYNLVPTTSTCLQLIFGDILTIALMEKKKFTLKEYAKNHPAGAIGKQIALTVEDLMIKNNDLPVCFAMDLLKDVLHILSSKKCGCLLIIDREKNLKGIFTDGDLRRVIQMHDLNFFNKKMEEIMIFSPIVINKKALAIDAMKKMEEKKQITVIPVVEKQKLVGLIRLHDIIQTGLKTLV